MLSASFAVVFLASFGVSVVLVPIIIRVCNRNGYYDTKGGRKIHQGDIGRLGGLAMFAGSLTGLLLIFSGNNYSVPFKVPVLLSAFTLAFLTGFIDDIYRIRARYKLMLQIVCGVLVHFAGLTIHKITLYQGFDLRFGWLSLVVTVFWVVLFMNAVNLIDGMDGLASGIMLIASLFLIVMSMMLGMYLITVITIAFVGAILGFYLYNFPPAKIFMGDGGAYLLGFMYAVISLMGHSKTSVSAVLLVPLVLMMVPLVDILQVMNKRMRDGYGIFIADKNHIHHRLMSLGFSVKGILTVLYGFTILLGSAGLLMLRLQPHESIAIFIILFSFSILTLLMITRLEKGENKIGIVFPFWINRKK